MRRISPSRSVSSLVSRKLQGLTRRQDFAFAGVAVQDLDRDTAKELGLKANARCRGHKRRTDSGADKAGLMPGDVIREINRQPVKSVKEFEKVSSAVKKGENVLILINRRGSSLFLSAKVHGESPRELSSAIVSSGLTRLGRPLERLRNFLRRDVRQRHMWWHR